MMKRFLKNSFVPTFPAQPTFEEHLSLGINVRKEELAQQLGWEERERPLLLNNLFVLTFSAQPMALPTACCEPPGPTWQAGWEKLIPFFLYLVVDN